MITCLLVLLTGFIGFFRLTIDTDIVRSLPSGESIIQDGLEIFQNHPVHDQIAIDIRINKDDPDILVQCGDIVEEKLKESKLFAEIGTEKISRLIPDIAIHVLNNLPFLFSAEDLEKEIAPRLDAQFIQTRLSEQLLKLSNLEGIGQAAFIEQDPLGFLEPVMAQMAKMAPFEGSRMYKNHVLSADNRHLLIVARPYTSGTNTGAARTLSTLLYQIEGELAAHYAGDGIDVTMTPVGAYRASLDNEEMIRHDVNLALFLSILGISLLLLTAFSRPWLGLLSFLPAVAGSAAALFLFSLFHNSISIMVLGFGGAIISITVDHGIAYLLFLDCPQKTEGRNASREVRAVGILAVLTTCGAFLLLSFSHFPIFVQLGQFTALGVFFSFLFVHFLFPHITPSMPAATGRSLPLQKGVDMLYSTGTPGAMAALIFAGFMVFWMRPDFNVSLESMNTVSPQTMAADRLFKDVWGDIGSTVFLMNSADDIGTIQDKNDALLLQLNDAEKSGAVASAFVPSMIFPGMLRSEHNLAAWHHFWNQERRDAFLENLQKIGHRIGYSQTAFAEFTKTIQPSWQPLPSPMPPAFYGLMRISEKNGKLVQFVSVSPGDRYDSEEFYASHTPEWKVFDTPFFTKQLADILFATFSTMLGLIAGSVVILLLFFFLSWQLTLITLTPPLFSYICTLGTMKLIGHPIDIPGLMLSIVILGMGIDYSIFFVRAQQRYRSPDHPSFQRIRMAVFMAGCSTLISFAVLCFADHALLRSIGVTSFLGIGYALLGAFLLLPPLLQYFFSEKRARTTTDSHLTLTDRVLQRYRLTEAYPKMFARFKLKSDPLFNDLQTLLAAGTTPAAITTILDIGCGYGVPGCWALEYFPGSHITGIDPDPERVRIASLAAGKRGTILQAMAPDLPVAENSTDLVLILDMLHYLDDNTTRSLFQNCFTALKSDSILIMRYVIHPVSKPSKSWRLEDYRVKLSGNHAHYRSSKEMAVLLTQCGFNIVHNHVSDTNSELFWITAKS